MTRLRLVLLAACIGCGLSFYAWQNYQRQQIAEQFSSTDIALLRQIYNESQAIITELQLIHDKKGIKLHSPKSYAAMRQTRHLWHKSYAVLMEINHLNEYKNLEKIDVSRFEEHEADLQSVDDIVDKVKVEVLNLKQAYSVNVQAEYSHTNSLILPNDLYNNLQQITRMISSLERSEGYVVAPTHVYRIAKTIVSELRKITNNTLPLVVESSGKRPRDVYNQAHILMKKIQELSDNPKYNITGGVVLLDKDGGHIIPSDVFNVLVNILADV